MGHATRPLSGACNQTPIGCSCLRHSSEHSPSQVHRSRAPLVNHRGDTPVKKSLQIAVKNDQYSITKNNDLTGYCTIQYFVTNTVSLLMSTEALDISRAA